MYNSGLGENLHYWTTQDSKTNFSTEELALLIGDDYPNFILNYSMPGMTTLHKMALLIYYACTSLSTVGFGDYHPVSSPERLATVFILLFGVMVFSYIMGEFIDILNSYKDMEADLDNGEELQKFFGLLKFLNHDVPINYDLKDKIESHFDYKW